MTFNFRKEKYDEKGVIYGGSDCCNDDDTAGYGTGSCEQTGEVVQQTEEDVSEPDMAADYQMETDLAAEINVFSADNNETPIVVLIQRARKADKDAEEGDKEPEIKTGWQTEEGKTYYYDEKGNKSVGEKKIDGKWYYFGEDVVMQIGFVQLTSKRVCYGEDGAMLYGKQSVGGKDTILIRKQVL